MAVFGEDAQGNREEWIARVVVFFSGKKRNGEAFKVAFVRFFMALNDKRADPLTGFPVYRSANTREGNCGLVDVDSILRVVHMVPKTWPSNGVPVPDKDMLYYLNLDLNL